MIHRYFGIGIAAPADLDENVRRALEWCWREGVIIRIVTTTRRTYSGGSKRLLRIHYRNEYHLTHPCGSERQDEDFLSAARLLRDVVLITAVDTTSSNR